MGKIEDVIRSFGGHQYKLCYRDLCCVIAVELGYQPNPPKMKVIVVEASQRGRNRSPSVSVKPIICAGYALFEGLGVVKTV